MSAVRAKLPEKQAAAFPWSCHLKIFLEFLIKFYVVMSELAAFCCVYMHCHTYGNIWAFQILFLSADTQNSMKTSLVSAVDL